MHLPRLILLLPLLVSAACDASEPPPAAARPAAQPAEVGVLTVAPTPVTLTRELPGRVVARRVAEVRARVSGIVEKRLFEEGSDVKEGQLLYRIEPEPYEASLAAARANLARAEAALPAARDLARRDQELLRTGAVSIEAAERSAAQLRQLEAEIAANRAAVKSAKINREYTTVTAPISGRIGRSYVTEGAYVQAGAATLMATIQQLDPVYVDVTQPIAELQRLRRELAGDRLQPPDTAAVRLVLEDGSLYSEPGTLQFADVTVDEGTGSVTLRALFPNPRGELLPGMFVRAVIEQGEDPAALLVPQRALTRDQRGQAYLFVVGPDNKLERRPVVADRVIGHNWRIVEGLAPGEQIVVDGLQRARHGAVVTPVPATDGVAPIPTPPATSDPKPAPASDAPARTPTSAPERP